DGRTLTYTSYDMVSTVTKGSHQTTFSYGPDRARTKRVDSNGGNTQTTLYIGGVEKITQADGTKRVKRHIAGVVIETESYTSGGSLTGEERHYSLKDHLGSQDTLTDSTGNVIANGGQLSFDPWGQRRNATAWSNLDSSQIIANYGVFASLAPPTTRGFTNHEMADEVGIIHMNGRIYDPKLGRFLQADPFVQAPDDLQMYNRYSYVRNNPLNATDPSGYFSFKQIFSIAVVAIVSIATYGAASAWAAGTTWGATATGTLTMSGAMAAGAMAGAAGGVVSGLIATGTLGGGLSGAAFGALSGAAFGGIGAPALGPTARVGAHATAGGVLNVLQGGKFGHGFISAGFTKFAITNWIDQIGSDDRDGILGRTAIASVTGGTVSELTGGKFANGAQTAAFAHLFNQESGRIAQRVRAQIVARAEQALADDEPYGINDKSGLFGPGTYK